MACSGLLSDPDPRAARWCVPVRASADRSSCWTTLRFFRTPFGRRTAVAFSTAHRLRQVLGDDHLWQVLSEPVLRELIMPLGITMITFDPQLTAPFPADLDRDPLSLTLAGHRG
ncbi:SAV_915 family protein [Microlunatus speluncae]|uniref:SAV_915 family protein n=1 Tax=Microlunatus speluncae TaxID=2594267 RepID=UPI00126626D0|nr:SAV_915 family protein [Microlunatus speluncae]